MAFADPELWRQRRGWRHPLIRIRRSALAWIAAVVILGGFALLGVTGPSSGKTSAKSPAPLPAMVPAPVTVPVSKSSLGTKVTVRHRPRPRRTAKTAAGQRSQRQPGAAATAPATATAPAATPAPHSSASTQRSTPAPAVLVRYFVDGVSGGTFQGEVDVVNNGRQPLAGWQIVVALEGDEVTAVQNAVGFDSNGILLMQPAASSEIVPPDGGTLRVFFAAKGPRTIPLACAFNSVSCQ
jgi:hypothetical protein